MAYILNSKQNIDQIFNIFNGVVWVNCNYFFDKSVIKENNEAIDITWFRKRELPTNYRVCPTNYLNKLELKKYANNTVKTYVSSFETFINYYQTKELIAINENDIRNYILKLIQEDKSNSFINSAINSIKFYYEIVLGMPNRFYSVERPRKKESLPKVISLEEVQSMILNTNNIKHRCIVSLLYSSGLRRGELLNLKLEDIDSKRMVITVINGKGGKDRLTVLSQCVLNDLRRYFIEWKPKTFLFEGKSNEKYSAESVSKIVKNASRKAKIRKNLTPHMLRHSFATHLLENGTDLRYIQTLLGHNSSRTTEVYTQVAINNIQKIKSPIELLNLG
jgi:site-specific recombinase XerD